MEIWTLNRIVRKLAHLTEFTILGGVLYTILRRYINMATVIKDYRFRNVDS